jgi:DNA topoisomerase II
VQGLGTSTSAEGREYFQNLELHVKNFVFGESTVNALDLAFSSDRTEDRKVWLKNYSRSSARIPPTQKDILYEDFINKDLINYSYTDLKRSIPSLIDGLKISQRKILYTCLKENIRKEIKVGQLSGLTTDVAAYHHGEAALHQSIIKMAQDFVGSNNVPLLEPCGQFGTRHHGGSDSASARYIFTRLSPITDLIFPESDMHILRYETEDGKQVEPSFFLPILPMILVNGTRGIGTGWSTNVLNYNPLDISDYLSRKIRWVKPILSSCSLSHTRLVVVNQYIRKCSLGSEGSRSSPHDLRLCSRGTGTDQLLLEANHLNRNCHEEV